jgi:hypothetical protein
MVHLKAFRNQYPEGRNWVVCQDVTTGYDKQIRNIHIEFMGLEEFRKKLK